VCSSDLAFDNIQLENKVAGARRVVVGAGKIIFSLLESSESPFMRISSSPLFLISAGTFDDYDDDDKEEYDKEEEEYDLEEEEEEEMARAPAAGQGSAGQGAAGRGTAAAAAARRSPPRAAAAGVDALVAGMANARMADPPFQAFNFDTASISILADTQTMSATGRRNVIGTFLIPNSHETDVSVTVSADGWYAELSLRVPPMFLYLVDRFAQEMGANDPDAPIVEASLRAVENQILYQHPDCENIRTNVQQLRLPFTCIQNPVIDFL
jgi:hypothetical protein